VIDGVRLVFMNTPFAEAPAELMFYLPQMQAFYAAEEANSTLHNLYTLRGAQIRDALLWSGYLYEAKDFISAETEVLFGGHHWPRWGYDNIVEYLTKQGDAYKYIHDQTLRLANHGFTMDEISEQIRLPPELGQAWYNRGYYGTVSHNVRAVYQKYLGFFDGNPANLHKLPAEESGRKYVEFMGGADALLRNARKAYANAEYRWVAEVVNHLVFADPSNVEARQLQADALEQLGYQAESGQWRNFYLTAASELRHGVLTAGTTRTLSPDMVNALSLNDFFDYLAVRLNGPKAAGKNIVINFKFRDSGDDYLVSVVNGVLHHQPEGQSSSADATVTLTRGGLLAMAMLGQAISVLTAAGLVDIEGDAAALEQLIALLDNFEFWFNIVTP
ncbi:MAG: MBL fold metallo-hydrolase, partial [Gammaproteobacteria bacterium]|nr:MBL fold metallo-hydrolase [Gammaproteobacteria bacterium]